MSQIYGIITSIKHQALLIPKLKEFEFKPKLNFNLLPSLADIKDGLLKIILYANLKTVQINKQTHKAQAVLKLTSNKINGQINSNDNLGKIAQFFSQNNFKSKQKQQLNALFAGAKSNNFMLEIGEK